jgi:hypothetical protein
MAAHSTLQYLPEVVRHEQTGCAHFSAFVVAIVSPSRGLTLRNPHRNPHDDPRRGKQERLCNKEHCDWDSELGESGSVQDPQRKLCSMEQRACWPRLRFLRDLA